MHLLPMEKTEDLQQGPQERVSGPDKEAGDSECELVLMEEGLQQPLLNYASQKLIPADI
jgi:hypothetical protein